MAAFQPSSSVGAGFNITKTKEKWAKIKVYSMAAYKLVKHYDN
jgi:hypothetical protein